MRLSAFLCLLLALASTAADADSFIKRVPCGYQQITSLSATSAQALSVPAPANCGGVVSFAVITAEAQAVRYRDDGIAPTASAGMPLPINTPLSYEGNLSAIQFIAQTSGAILNILFYR